MARKQPCRLDIQITDEHHKLFARAANKRGFQTVSEWARVSLVAAALGETFVATYPCGSLDACRLKSKVSVPPPKE